jgi:hypothetical protein
MSGLRSDMYGLGWICPARGPDIFDHQKLRVAEK